MIRETKFFEGVSLSSPFLFFLSDELAQGRVIYWAQAQRLILVSCVNALEKAKDLKTQ